MGLSDSMKTTLASRKGGGGGEAGWGGGLGLMDITKRRSENMCEGWF